ncbi:MAG: nucleotide disphospho-sugar-binding domain-containing protein, partial [Pseudomonadota bacterium]
VGRRALLLVGRADNLAGLPEGPELMAATAAPYQLVFARAAAAVHQGGIGTISLAIAAGLPMVLTPFSHDQPDNARRATRAGLAVLSTPALFRVRGAAHLRRVLADEAMSARLKAAAAQIRAEKGAERAAAEIRRAAQG